MNYINLPSVNSCSMVPRLTWVNMAMNLSPDFICNKPDFNSLSAPN